MKTKEIIKALEFEWDLEYGSLGMMRRGEFDKEKFDRLITLLKSIELGDKVLIEKRIVSLIWYIPLFLFWQKERLLNKGKTTNDLERVINIVEEIIEKILGIP